MDNEIKSEKSALDKYKEMLEEVTTSANTILDASANREIYAQLESTKSEYDKKRADLISKYKGAEAEVEAAKEAPEEAIEEVPAEEAEIEEIDPEIAEEEIASESPAWDAEEVADTAVAAERKEPVQTFVGKIGRSTIDFNASAIIMSGQGATSGAFETRDRVSKRYQKSKQGMLTILRNSAQNVVKKMDVALEVSEGPVVPLNEVKEITSDILL